MMIWNLEQEKKKNLREQDRDLRQVGKKDPLKVAVAGKFPMLNLFFSSLPTWQKFFEF